MRIPTARQVMDTLCKVIAGTGQVINVFLLVISPMALLMLLVALLMFPDHHRTHRRRIEALEAVPLTVAATIRMCEDNSHYCYAEFTDAEGHDRYGKLEWTYYAKPVKAELAKLERGDKIVVRYAHDQYVDDIVPAQQYDAFLHYKGYMYEMGGIAAVSWTILILHPEVMLYALVDDIGTHFDDKWQRMTNAL